MQVLQAEWHHIAAIHLAPACGTASKAREKKLLKWVRKGFKVPIPLRSQSKPVGVDGLADLDKVRTEMANQVYEITAKIVQFCIDNDLLCSVENPENSLFWLYPDIERLLQQFPGFHVTLANCMHGGKRNKLTKWWATKPVFADLAAPCDQKHQHAKWNPVQQGNSLVVPTAEEAAYPHLLCKRLRAILLQYATSLGAVVPQNLVEQLPSPQATSHRWVLDMLPKGKKLRPLVSEFRDYKYFLVNPSQEGVKCGSKNNRAKLQSCGLTAQQESASSLKIEPQL